MFIFNVHIISDTWSQRQNTTGPEDNGLACYRREWYIYKGEVNAYYLVAVNEEYSIVLIEPQTSNSSLASEI